LADLHEILTWAAVAAGLAPVWGTLLWELWQGGVRPRLLGRGEIERAAARMLARHGERAEQMASIEEDRAWRYSDSFKRGHWRRVRKCIAAMRLEPSYAAASRASAPLASISRRSQIGDTSKPFGQVGTPSSRNTRSK
jgi:hypothetical protein